MLRRAAVVSGAAALSCGVLGIAASQASATISPTLTLTPNTVPAGAPANASVEFDIAANGGSDTFKDVAMILPPGLLANANLDGGICLLSPLSSSTPPACQVATAKLNGFPTTNASLYLVQPPVPTAVAGIGLCLGASSCTTPVTTGTVTVRGTTDPNGSGLDVAFTNLAAGTTELDATFTGLRTPTSCAPASVSVLADSQSDPTVKSDTKPLTVTGCSSLLFNPGVSASVIKDSADSGAEVVTTTSQPGALSESATKMLVLAVPSSISPNVAAVASCFAGTPCKVGSATGASPLVPSAALSGGTVTLGGLITAPVLTVSFPAVNLTLTGTFNSTFTAITFNNVPDTPLSSLAVDITGTAAGRAFTTNCAASNYSVTFTPWDGNAAVTRTAPIAFSGCSSSTTPPPPAVGKPTVAGAISGLPAGHAKLRFTVHHGTNAPNIKMVAVTPAKGLAFKKCTVKHHKCTGLSVSGATLSSVKVSGGRLMITLTSAAASVTVTVSGPVLVESKALQTNVKKHKVKSLTLTVRAVDAKGTGTSLPLKLKA
jgi:hypothetical protein